MWNAKVKQLASENLAVLGVVQEQHAERTKLYKQWKQYEFPIAQDPVTKLGLAVVPIFVGIDEYGIVQETRLKPNMLEKFLNTEFDQPESEAAIADANTDYAKLASEDTTVENLCLAGDQEMLFKTSGADSYDKALASYGAALEKDPNNGVIMFRLGAAYRKRYDEKSHDDADFDQASRFWTLALASNPRQYIWRRRIEQYGPRLEKPYPFYDWVETAVEEVKERGETPVELTVALTQSEKAGRSKPNYDHGDSKPESADGIELDEGQFISIESTVVPGYVQPGKTGTVHLRFVANRAKWNNESRPLTIWLESDSAKLSKQLLTFENPKMADSSENRLFEFDLVVGKETKDCKVKGFALYNVCNEHGICMFRRQNFEIDVAVGK